MGLLAILSAFVERIPNQVEYSALNLSAAVLNVLTKIARTTLPLLSTSVLIWIRFCMQLGRMIVKRNQTLGPLRNVVWCGVTLILLVLPYHLGLWHLEKKTVTSTQPLVASSKLCNMTREVRTWHSSNQPLW